MASQPFAIDLLRSFIGTAVSHRGRICCVIEVLEEGPALVLLDQHDEMLQDTQHGAPGRKVPVTYVLPVLAEDGLEMHGEFAALEVLKRHC